MKSSLFKGLVAASALFVATLPCFSAEGELLDVRDVPEAPIPVIFDTDIGGDIDDAFALAILHNFADRGVCRLLGVTTTDAAPAVSGYLAAFNARYGRPDLPVGRGGGRSHDNYLSGITSQKNAALELEYPIPEGFQEHDAVPLLRELLAAAEDHSVVIIQVGRYSNLSALLDTPGDAISPLSGRELAEKKVRLLSIMGGSFAVEPGDAYEKHREWNVISDIPAAQKLVREWPGEIVFSGYEVGDRIKLSPVNLKRDYTGRAKILYDSFGYWAAKNTKEGYNHRRPTWDLTSVLFVLRPEEERGYFTLSAPGTVDYDDAGTTIFTADPSGNCRYFIVDDDARVRVAETFVNLCSEP